MGLNSKYIFTSSYENNSVMLSTVRGCTRFDVDLGNQSSRLTFFINYGRNFKVIVSNFIFLLINKR